MAESDTSEPEADTPAYFVYVLLNGAGVAYTGIALDVEARLARHNAGLGARFTRGRGPWRVAQVEGPLAHGEALRRERALKRDRRFKAALKAEAGLGEPPSGRYDHAPFPADEDAPAR